MALFCPRQNREEMKNTERLEKVGKTRENAGNVHETNFRFETTLPTQRRNALGQ